MRIHSFAIVVITGLCLCLVVMARGAVAGPYADPGYLPSEMAAWASSVDEFSVGPVDVAQPALGLASFGLPQYVLGASLTGGTVGTGDVLSLGDGGSITLYFDAGIGDGLGDDFAVFENGFVDQSSGYFFGEFAFVEVSTDGVDFVRFPALSLQATPVSAFGVVDPSDYHNLAGDQMVGVGSGFDLHDLIDDPLVQDATVALTEIRFVRIIDVIGDGSTFDELGQPIYDPYATAFASGGFDVEAIGVLHTVPEPGRASGLSIGFLVMLGAVQARRGRKPCVFAG
ncbi:MAG: PEP-CTERM sorting domain-containing protein [Myxococcota bacterium]